MYKKIAPYKTVLATKKLISEYRNMEKLGHERPLSELRLKVYREILKRGDFRPCIWAKAFCRENERTIRVNGQHTSHLLHEFIDRKEEIPEFYVTLGEYVCDTLEDVSRLYTTFDTNEATRNITDINRAFAGFKPELRDVPGRILNVCVSGIAFHQFKDGMWVVKSADRAEEVLEHVPFVLWVREILGVKGDNDTRIKMYAAMKRMAVASAMFATWEATRGNREDKASHFWDCVREISETNNCPTHRLAHFLYDFKVTQTRDCREGGSDYKRIYYTCCKAWNYWVAGKKMNKLTLEESDMKAEYQQP